MLLARPESRLRRLGYRLDRFGLLLDQSRDLFLLIGRQLFDVLQRPLQSFDHGLSLPRFDAWVAPEYTIRALLLPCRSLMLSLISSSVNLRCLSSSVLVLAVLPLFLPSATSASSAVQFSSSYPRLRRGPPRQPLIQAHALQRAPLAPRPRLHRLKAPPEAPVRLAQRLLRLDAQIPGQRRHRKQHIAQLRRSLVLCPLCPRRHQLARLLRHLLRRARRVRPGEPDLRRLLHQLVRLIERRRALRHATQRALRPHVLTLRRALRLLDDLPVAHHMRRVAHLHLAEDVRVPPDQLLRDRLVHVADV